LNILLIDDNVNCLEILAATLKSAGYRCDEFTVPEKALEAYQHNQYDVVITDLMMPGINGIQVLKQIHSLNTEAKVIIITGDREEQTVINIFNNGAYAFFNKPINFVHLMETLEKIRA